MRCSSRSLLARICVLWEAGLVEHLARLDAQIGEVARVEPDARELVAVHAQLAADLDRVAHAFERMS